MLMTVRDVLQLEVMKGARNFTSDTFLDTRIEWVSIIEVPVENFVRPKEFVLSTAVGCGQDPALFREFLQALIDSGAAALAVAAGRHLKEFPPEAIQLAEKWGMPLIELPWETRFADIMQELFRILDHRGDQMAAYSKETQEELLQLILQGADLSRLATVIYRKLHYPALFVDHKGDLKGGSPSSQPLIQLWQNPCTPLPAHSDPLPGSFHGQGEWRLHRTRGRSFLEFPIRSARKRQGSLLLLLPPEADLAAPLRREEHIFLEHATTAAALCFLQETVVVETEMRFKSDFVWSLAKGEISSPESATARAETLGYNLTVPYTCILGMPEPLGSEPYASRFDEQGFPGLMDDVHYAARVIRRNLLATRQLDQLILFLEAAPNQVIDHVQSYLDVLEGRLHERFPDRAVSWGIGENHTGIFTFRDSYLAAHSALTIGRRQKGPGQRNFYMDTGLYRALEQLAEHPEMREITWSAMSRLLDYSRQRGIDLIETFNAYLRNQMNVSQTARELNLHRQSLLYRLRKIESLTGRSLFNPDDLFLLQLSIKLWQSKGKIK
ncbi:PucR family transcriptional regulator [Salinithrix halophila]|uniref:PucR family transcriptional regulator n=1 Tax=Salinithrix halophila TaxID=1485204 RepID=A0ABV8JJ58_9BACL